jgi:Domain of unknown function (DUF4326)
MAWQERKKQTKGFTQIKDKAMAVAWFARFVSVDSGKFSELRGKNLACWCALGGPCHADVLLHFANRGESLGSGLNAVEKN